MKNVLIKLASLFPHADKVLHFIVGSLIATLVLAVTGQPWLGFSAAFLAGLYREFSDHIKAKSSLGVNTWLDWIATMLGGLVVELVW